MVLTGVLGGSLVEATWLSGAKADSSSESSSSMWQVCRAQHLGVQNRWLHLEHLCQSPLGALLHLWHPIGLTDGRALDARDIDRTRCPGAE